MRSYKKILNCTLIKTGEVPAPYYAWRIAIILSKEKQKDKEAEFLQAWCRHFKFCAGTRYQQITARAVKKGIISSEGIPSPEDILSMARRLIEEYGLDARIVSDNMRLQAFENGSEMEYLYRCLLWEKVMWLTYHEIIKPSEEK